MRLARYRYGLQGKCNVKTNIGSGAAVNHLGLVRSDVTVYASPADPLQ